MYHFGHAWSHVVRPLKPVYWDEATRALGQRDRVLRRLIRAYPDIHLRRRHDPFTTLARAIVGQQISVKAADSIWRRFVATVKPGTRSTAFPRLDPVVVAAADIARFANAAYRDARSTTCAISHRASSPARSTPSRGARWKTRRSSKHWWKSRASAGGPRRCS
jgi:hypothetical protein